MATENKTAVQKSIDYLKKQKEILKNHFESGKWNDDRCSEIDNCITILEGNLELEKQQMVDFHVEVMKKGLLIENEIVWTDDYLPKISEIAEDYFSQTYGGDNE